MQNHYPADPRIIKAFEALLNQRRATYLLVNRHNHLLHICSDPLGLLAGQTKGDSCQDILKQLPVSLKQPVANALQQAQINAGQIQCCQVNAIDSTVTIETQLHPATSSTDEFLTLLIASEESASNSDLVEVNKHLRAEVLERQQTEQELASKAEALARSNADLEEFAYVISHDLQEPLRAMTAFSQLLEQRYQAHLDASARQYISHIVNGGTRMKAMIDGILELSRINNTRLNNNPTDLEQALETVLENLKLIRLETQTIVTHNTLPTLYVDKNHIVQLLQNLIGNAIKFRGTGSPKIHINAEQNATGWLFHIHDNGIGIPQDQQKRIFKLFQRLHTQQEQKGYGIGLAICKKIVECYQGTIWLKSSPGEGSIFSFTLPVDTYQDEA